MTTGSSEASDRVVVVAKVSRTTIAIVAFLALPTIYALVTTPNLGWAMVLIAHAAVLHRVTQISVSVSEEGVLVLMLDTNNREGQIEKGVTVNSNDLATPLKKLMMRCDVSLGVVSAPTSVHFGRHPRNTPGTGVLTLPGW